MTHTLKVVGPSSSVCIPANYRFAYRMTSNKAEPCTMVTDKLHDINRVNESLPPTQTEHLTKALYQLAMLPNQLFHLSIYRIAHMMLQLFSIAVAKPP